MSIIRYNELSKLPDRRSLLDKDAIEIDEQTINKGESLLFLANDCYEECIRHSETEYKTYIIMHGISLSGLNITVAMYIKPTFYIRVPDEYLGFNPLKQCNDTELMKKANTFMEEVKHILQSENITITRDCNWKIIRKYHSRGYQMYKGFYIQAEFNTLYKRNQAIKLISVEANSSNLKKVLGYYCHTAMDDKSCYYRIVGRTKLINYCSWLRIKEKSYKIEGRKNSSNIFGEIFNGDYLISTTDDCIETLQQEYITNDMKRDPSICMGWDIEALRYDDDGMLPDPKCVNDELLMIGFSIGFHHSNPLINICIVVGECEPSDDYITVICADEKELLLATLQLFNNIKPQFTYGFNDGHFDWEFLTEKLYSYGLLEYAKSKMSTLYKPTEIKAKDQHKISEIIRDQAQKDNVINEDQARNFLRGILIMGDKHREQNKNIYGQHFVSETCKFDADTTDEINILKFNGYIPIDVMCMLRAVERNPEEYSLNSFLKRYKLDLKKDMEISELRSIFLRVKHARENNDYQAVINESNNMALVASYCVVDAISCINLMRKKNVIQDRRFVSLMAYTSMFDGIYRADGVKVRNYVICEAEKRDILYSNITPDFKSKDQIAGGYVVAPVKGMQTTKLSLRELRKSDQAGYKWKYVWPGVSIRDPITEPNIATCNYSTLTDNELEIYEQWIQNNYVKFKTDQLDRKSLNLWYEQINSLPCKHNTEFIAWLTNGTGLPVSGLDFSSLYPSIIMTYNLSPEYMIVKDYNDPNGSEKLKQQAELIQHICNLEYYHINFPYANTVLEAYSFRHTFDPSSLTDNDDLSQTMRCCNFGIFPSALYIMFNERKRVKKLMGIHKDKVEHLENEIAKLKANNQDYSCIENSQEYIDQVFLYEYYNSIQKAVKVFMNTFYGQCASSMSSLFMPELSGAITSAGQRNLKLIIETIQSANAQVLYGDTDSAYVRCDEKIYLDSMALYYTNKITKLELWNIMVNETIPEIERLKKLVNLTLYNNNGTSFLVVAYEEVLFAVLLCGKKKYVGIPHEKCANFLSYKMFIRGLEMVKKGVPEILKKLCNDIINSIGDVNEIRSIRQIVYDTVRFAYTNNWSTEDFVATCMYKPLKKNICVNLFVDRMKQENNVTIKPLDRVRYVLVDKPPFRHNLQGNVEHLKKGDFMEIPEIAEQKGMSISIDKYMSIAIRTQFARLCVYHLDFAADDDDTSMNIAKTWVESCIKAYQKVYVNPHQIYKSTYKTTKKHVDLCIERIFGTTNLLKSTSTDKRYLVNIVEKISHKVETDAKIWADNQYKSLCKESEKGKLLKLFVTSNYYPNILIDYENKIQLCIHDIHKTSTQLTNIQTIKQDIINKIVDQFRKPTDVTDGVDKKRLEDLPQLINDEISYIDITSLMSKLEWYIICKVRYTNLIIMIKENHAKIDRLPKHIDSYALINDDIDMTDLSNVTIY